MSRADSILKYKSLVFVPPVVAGGLYAYFLNSFAKSKKQKADTSAADKGSNEEIQATAQKEKASSGGAKKQSQRVGLNMRFIKQMQKLLPILIPGVFSREAGLLGALAAVLVARTWLDIWFSSFQGYVVKSIVSRDRKAFNASIFVVFALMMWPMSVVNNSLKLLINALSLSFRSRLTKHAQDMYLDGINYYKITNLDSRINNIDQLLTQDIDKFSSNLAHLYSDISKPIVDIVLFAYKLGQAIGKASPIYMILYFFSAGAFLRKISPPFGKYTATEQQLEGDFRFTHSRIITNAEEIAFYGGGQKEKILVNSSFRNIVSHLKKVFTLRFGNGIIESVVYKYCATILAYSLISRPVFNPKYATEHFGRGQDPKQLMEEYTTNSSYLINLSQAIGRIMMAGRDIARFAGYAERVAQLFDVLKDVKEGKYEKTLVNDGSDSVSVPQLIDVQTLKGKLEYSADGSITFEDVPVVTPNNDCLVKSLSFKIGRGMNCLVVGPNGCGKSSLFRILGELWPLYGGRVVKPKASEIFFVAQKPLLCIGTLRDQVIYPDTKDQAIKRGFTDAKLLEIMEKISISYLVDRETEGFESVQNWNEVLSGGKLSSR